MLNSKTIVLCLDEAFTQKITDCLQGEDVTCVHSEAELSAFLQPTDSALILVGVCDEHFEEGYAQMIRLKEQYPAAVPLLLPAGSEENFQFGIAQAKKLMQIEKAGHADERPCAAQDSVPSHEEEVDALMNQLMEKLGPAASEYIEEVGGVGYRFKPGALQLLFPTEIWHPRGE